MKLIKVLFFALAVITFGACNNSGNTADPAEEKTEQLAAEQEAWGETMAIHDRAMKNMGEVNRFKKLLTEKMANIDNEESKSVAKLAIDNLEAADEGMMEWMSNLMQLEDLRKNKSHEDIMSYLEEQKAAALKVEKDISDSMGNAKRILEPSKDK